jgi:hypothetical protein
MEETAEIANDKDIREGENLLCKCQFNSGNIQSNVLSEVGTISVIAIRLRYVFALLHNALYLWRIVFASDSYRSELAGQRYRFTLLSL